MTASRWSLDIDCGRLPRASREVDGDRLVVGRGAECDVQVSDQRLSRQHPRLECRGDELWAEERPASFVVAPHPFRGFGFGYGVVSR